jgi:putative endonuclease
MASPPVTSNVLSEQSASRRLADCESKGNSRHLDLRLRLGRWHRRRMAHYVYLLRCSDDSLYVGESSNLAAREQCHNEGRGGKYTAQRRPVRIVYAEEHGSKQDAVRRERQIKRWSQQKKELLVRGDGAALSGNSRRARSRAAFTWADWLAQRAEPSPESG